MTILKLANCLWKLQVVLLILKTSASGDVENPSLLSASKEVKKRVKKDVATELQQMIGGWRPVGTEIILVANEKRFWPHQSHEQSTVGQVRTIKQLPWIAWMNGRHYYMFSMFGRDLRLYFLDVRNDMVQLKAGVPPNQSDNYLKDSRLFRIARVAHSGINGLMHVKSGKFIGMRQLNAITLAALVEERNAFNFRFNSVKFQS